MQLFYEYHFSSIVLDQLPLHFLLFPYMQIVYQMVQVYGMNDKIGQVAFPKEEGQWPADKMYRCDEMTLSLFVQFSISAYYLHAGHCLVWWN